MPVSDIEYCVYSFILSTGILRDSLSPLKSSNFSVAITRVLAVLILTVLFLVFVRSREC